MYEAHKFQAGGAEFTASLMLEEKLRERDPEICERVLESVREALEAERAPMTP